MTADMRHRCRRSDDYRLKTTSTTATFTVVIFATVIAAARATTFEGGETATIPPDETVYMIEEVAAWNATAAAAGDYTYEDYDSTTADALQIPGGRYSPKPKKTFTPPVDVSIVVPTATITIQMPAATTTTEVPVTNTTTITTTTTSTTTTTNTAAITTTTAADTKTIYSTTSTVVQPSTSTVDQPSTSTVVQPFTSVTTVITATDVATFPTATTESGVLMQIASPLGYGVTNNVTTAVTTPAPTMTPSSSVPLLRCWRWTATLLLSLAFVANFAS